MSYLAAFGLLLGALRLYSYNVPAQLLFDKLEMSEALQESFLLALLLSGTVKRAEEAVCESIGVLDAGVVWPEILMVGTVTKSLRAPHEIATETPKWLPLELQRVMQLPRTLRQCFVMRILAGWPREKCAEVLRLDAEIVDDEACKAARTLARFAEKEQIAL